MTDFELLTRAFKAITQKFENSQNPDEKLILIDKARRILVETRAVLARQNRNGKRVETTSNLHGLFVVDRRNPKE